MAKKRDASRERRMAATWADYEMNLQQKSFPAGLTLPLFWDDIYRAYLAGLRAKHPPTTLPQEKI